MNASGLSFDQDGSLCGTVRTAHDRGAAGKCEPIIDPQLIDENDRDANDPQRYGEYLSFCDPFARQKYPGKNKPEQRDGRLQNGRESGRDVLFRPKYRAVIK